jgi:hypothetical protein
MKGLIIGRGDAGRGAAGIAIETGRDVNGGRTMGAAGVGDLGIA